MKKIFNEYYKFYFTVLAIGFVILGYLTFRTITFLSKAKQTPGEVVEIIYDSSDNTESPIFTFMDHNGLERTIKTPFSTNLITYSVGELVTINYDPENSSKAGIDNFMYIWDFHIVIGFIMLVVFVLSLKQELLHMNWLKKQKG